MNKAKVISFCGGIPVIGASLRRIARRYPEGSVVTIANGHLAGCQWKRSHRYVNGYWLGIYELQIQECLARELKPGDVFYDIGANAGFFTLLGAKRVGPHGRVFSFEPLPENIRSIQTLLDLNHIVNCTLVKAAVADHEGVVEFCAGRDASTAHIRKDGSADREGGTISVRCLKLDDFVKAAPRPSLVKMDIEGAELSALEGALGLLGCGTPPRMLIEFHSAQLMREGSTILRDHGYEVRSATGHANGATAARRHVLCIPAGRGRHESGGRP